MTQHHQQRQGALPGVSFCEWSPFTNNRPVMSVGFGVLMIPPCWLPPSAFIRGLRGPRPLSTSTAPRACRRSLMYGKTYISRLLFPLATASACHFYRSWEAGQPPMSGLYNGGPYQLVILPLPDR